MVATSVPPVSTRVASKVFRKNWVKFALLLLFMAIRTHLAFRAGSTRLGRFRSRYDRDGVYCPLNVEVRYEFFTKATSLGKISNSQQQIYYF